MPQPAHYLFILFPNASSGAIQNMSLSSTDKALCEAAKEGNATKILHLATQEGANVNCKDPDNVSEGGNVQGLRTKHCQYLWNASR